LSRFHRNTYADVPQCYVTRTLPILFLSLFLSLDFATTLLCRLHLIDTDVSVLRPQRPKRRGRRFNPIEVLKGNPVMQQCRYPNTKAVCLFKHDNLLNLCTFRIVFFNIHVLAMKPPSRDSIEIIVLGGIWHNGHSV